MINDHWPIWATIYYYDGDIRYMVVIYHLLIFYTNVDEEESLISTLRLSQQLLGKCFLLYNAEVTRYPHDTKYSTMDYQIYRITIAHGTLDYLVVLSFHPRPYFVQSNYCNNTRWKWAVIYIRIRFYNRKSFFTVLNTFLSCRYHCVFRQLYIS